MLPRDLGAASFAGYPPEARRIAATHLYLLRDLPLAFLPLLLRELISYDWKFPAERRELDRQLAYLASLPPAARRQELNGFHKLTIPPALEQTDWVNLPSRFSEDLTTHLWAARQIDDFRAAAVGYMQKAHAAAPDDPLPVHRVGLIVLGEGVPETRYRLFRKLRPHGIHFDRVRQENGLPVLLDFVAARAKAYPVSYGHWYVDGDRALDAIPAITCVSYAALSGLRTAIADRMQKAYSSGMGPEAFRTMLAQLRPDDFGATGSPDAVLARFQLSLLTEGSGTQVFSTTFVQWAAREALRRAEPLTLLARFAPRQRFRAMNELLADSQHKPELDLEGSLVDADMGAYYTWLNQQRLKEAALASFLVWYPDHGEAVAIGPGVARGTESHEPVRLEDLLRRL